MSTTATATVFNSRELFDQRLSERVMDHVGLAISHVRDFEPAAARHGQRERLLKLRVALLQAVAEFEGEVCR